MTTHGWRRRDARAIYEMHTGPNMTPMVDVVMVILIFFMASTVIMGPELLLRTGLDSTGAARRTPGADPAFAIDAPEFTIRLHTHDGAVVASGFGLDAEPLGMLTHAAASLAAETDPSSVTVVIVPEDEVPYEAVIVVQDMLTDAGFMSVRLR